MTVPPRTIDDTEMPRGVAEALQRRDKVLTAFLGSAAAIAPGADLSVTFSTGFNAVDCLVVAAGLSFIAADAFGRDDDRVEVAQCMRDVANMLADVWARIHNAGQDTPAGELH